MNRARLSAYARWQLSDFLVERLPGITVISASLGMLAWLTGGPVLRQRIASGDSDVTTYALLLFGNVVSMLWFPATIVAANQVVSRDRTSGRFRLLFAKPVSTRRYYLQAYVVNGALFLASAALLLAPIATVLHAPSAAFWHALAILGAAYLAIGGVCFLFSALTGLDWFFATALTFVEIVIHARFGSERWTRALPPFHLLTGQIDALREGRGADWGELAVLAMMGLLAVALGVWIIRRRPLAT